MRLFNIFFKSIWKRPNALIAFFLFSLLVAVCGFSLGKISEDAKIPAELLVTSLSGLATAIGLPFLNKFIELQITTEIEEKTKRIINQYHQQTTVKKQILDFLSFIQEKISVDKFDMEVHKELGEIGETTDNLKDRLVSNLKYLHVSHETLKSLIFAYIKDKEGNDVEILKIIVSRAIENKLIDRYHPEFKEKCNHLYAYLRGWLICSIKYDTHILPISWIKQTSLNREERIKVINEVRNLVIKNNVVQEHIPYEESRELIAKYLDILIQKIQEERSSSFII